MLLESTRRCSQLQGPDSWAEAARPSVIPKGVPARRRVHAVLQMLALSNAVLQMLALSNAVLEMLALSNAGIEAPGSWALVGSGRWPCEYMPFQHRRATDSGLIIFTPYPSPLPRSLAPHSSLLSSLLVP